MNFITDDFKKKKQKNINKIIIMTNGNRWKQLLKGRIRGKNLYYCEEFFWDDKKSVCKSFDTLSGLYGVHKLSVFCWKDHFLKIPFDSKCTVS